MARHVTITDEQILRAARKVFLEDGFTAPTSRIAQLAGVSEGSIFKRYSTKEALFFAALEIPELPEWHRLLKEEGDGADALATLRSAAIEMLTYFLEMFPRMITAIGSRVGSVHAHPFDGMKEPPHARDRAVVEAFIRRQQAVGAMRTGDAAAMAALLLGGIAHHAFVTYNFGTKPTRAEIQTTACGAVDALWLGFGPEDATTNR